MDSATAIVHLWNAVRYAAVPLWQGHPQGGCPRDCRNRKPRSAKNLLAFLPSMIHNKRAVCWRGLMPCRPLRRAESTKIVPAPSNGVVELTTSTLRELR